VAQCAKRKSLDRRGLLAADGEVHPAGASNGGNRHLESLRV
jgi:hypothetical protein